MRSQSAVARLLALLITFLALMVAGILALPGSASDYTVATVYPLMLPPAVLIIGIAGLVAAYRPSTARAVAVFCAVNGSQVTGIAVVAARDWLNFGGADESSHRRALVGSWLALAIAAVAVGAVVASVTLYRCRAYRPSVLPSQTGVVIAGLATAAGLPISAYVFWDEAGLSAVGQVALWWSLPWAAGVYAAGVLPTKALRAAVLSSVATSVAVTVGCAAAAPIHGFGLRLPYGFDSPLLHYAKPGPLAGQPRTVRRTVTTDARSTDECVALEHMCSIAPQRTHREFGLVVGGAPSARRVGNWRGSVDRR